MQTDCENCGIGVAVSYDCDQMPFAAITCGNHELYIDSTIENMVQVKLFSTTLAYRLSFSCSSQALRAFLHLHRMRTGL